MHLRTVPLSCLVAFCLGASPAPPATGAGPAESKPQGDFTPLFNGRDLDGWYTFLQQHGKDSDPDHIVTVEDGAIHLYKDAPDGSNVVMGYIATAKEYGDYHLRFQYRWGAKKFQPRLALKRDAGFYYHIQGPDLVWPLALQYQVQQTDVGDLIALYGIKVETTVDPKTRANDQTRDVTCPRFLDPAQGGVPLAVGADGRHSYLGRLAGDLEVEGWNTAEIIARGDSFTHLLNGKVVNAGTHARVADPDRPGEFKPVNRGRLAVEIEAAELWFRNIEIRSLEAAAAGR